LAGVDVHFGEERLYQEADLVARWEAELVERWEAELVERWEAELVEELVVHLRLVRYHLVGHHLPLTPVAQ
jgi:hypothetical protein